EKFRLPSRRLSTTPRRTERGVESIAERLQPTSRLKSLRGDKLMPAKPTGRTVAVETRAACLGMFSSAPGPNRTRPAPPRTVRNENTRVAWRYVNSVGAAAPLIPPEGLVEGRYSGEGKESK